ncbi:hypothetical protein CGLO_14290 [Colletotrichum gloeosporioides Cg-14]|uniref:Protein kinase domain-containing protein n=1 Tax=Colletotrichum gloeosporioides (strain Cg-14) TaxID=1237896 RepID=T0K1R3_COLGC|nr:hypothetical protein CGLO_14290 [Colletotrichum gloeosporioides Cg-14]
MSSSISDREMPYFVSNPPLYKGGELKSLPKFKGTDNVVLDCLTGLDKQLHFETNGVIARKSFKLALLSNPDDLKFDKERFQKELELLCHAQHHHVVKLIYAYMYEPREGDSDSVHPHAAIIMEKAQQLCEELDNQCDSNEELILKWFGCLATTVVYLHGIGIRHGDIKPENILVRNNKVLLADFGISNMILGRTLSTTKQGAQRPRTEAYCAPEIDGGSSRSFSADIFSLGAVFTWMLAGLLNEEQELRTALRGNSHNGSPSFAANLASVKSKMESWKPKLPKRQYSQVWKDGVPTWQRDLISLCQEMMHEDHFKRPTASDVAKRIFRLNLSGQNVPCQCGSSPETPRARLLYFCQKGGIGTHMDPASLQSLNATVGAVQQAAAHGHLEDLQALQRHGFDINLPDHSGQTALHCAASFGEEGIVTYLLRLPEIHEAVKDNDQRTALHYAAGRGHARIVEKLLDASKDSAVYAQQKDKDGRTAFHFAAARGRRQVMESLIRLHGQDVNQTDLNGVTALHLAAGYGSVGVVDLLLGHGVKTGLAQREPEWSCLNFAINGHQTRDESEDRGRYDDVLERLVRNVNLPTRLRAACANAANGEPCDDLGRKRYVCDFVRRDMGYDIAWEPSTRSERNQEEATPATSFFKKNSMRESSDQEEGGYIMESKVSKFQGDNEGQDDEDQDDEDQDEVNPYEVYQDVEDQDDDHYNNDYQEQAFTILFHGHNLVSVIKQNSSGSAKKVLCDNYTYPSLIESDLDEHMMAMAETIQQGLKNPDLGLKERSVINGLPKLRSPPGIIREQGKSGCGFHTTQGYCLIKVLFWAGVMFLPGLAFIILWLLKVDALDLQNAFVPITFLAAVIAIILGITQMRGV